MVTRLIGLLLGLALAAWGYGTVEPQGFTAPYVPAIDLGPFAARKMMVAYIALGFGVVLAIAAVLPRGRRKAKAAYHGVDFHDEPEAEPEHDHHPAPKMGGAAQPSPLW